MDNLFEVGPSKPMGYLPIDAITTRGWSADRVLLWAASAGLSGKAFKDGECHIASGAVYVWDADAVQRFLDLNLEITVDSGWPCDASLFVDAVATRFADRPGIYDLVGAMFRDERMSNSEWITRA